MAAQNLWFYRDQIFRIVEESMEVALVICNSELSEFTLAKNSETEVTPVTGGTAGYTLHIKLTFQYKKIERGRPRRKKDENLNINQDQVIPVAIYSRFNIQREYYPSMHTIMFQPSPFFYETYGTYFTRLLHLRPSLLSSIPPESSQRYYTTPVEHMPHFSLILQHVNLPLFTFSKNIHAVFAHLEPPRLKKMAHNKGSQTEEREQVTEVWKYKELIGNLKPLWSDSRTPSCESIFNSAPTTNNVGYVFENFVLEDKPVLGQSTITELETEIKEELAPNAISESIIITADHLNGAEVTDIKPEPLEVPTSTSLDKEYDVQWPTWGYQKVVTKKRNKKKNPNSVLYKDVLMGPDTTVNGFSEIQIKPETDISTNGIFSETGNGIGSESDPKSLYATVAKSPKIKEDAFEYTAETRARVYESYKDDPDFLWFERQFPDVHRSTSLTVAQRNENFEIAEEFIREEKAREKKKGKKRAAK